MTWIHVWILLSTFGSILSLRLARESWLDLQSFGPKWRIPFVRSLGWRRGWRWPLIFTEGNGSVRHAVSRFIRELLRITVHIGYLGIGIPAWDRVVEMSPALAGLMWGNLVLVTNSLIDSTTIRGSMPRWRNAHRQETAIEKQDRDVGDQRRAMQAAEPETLPTTNDGK